MGKNNRQRRAAKQRRGSGSGGGGGRVTPPLRMVRPGERSSDPGAGSSRGQGERTASQARYGRPLSWAQLSTDELLDIVIDAHLRRETAGLYEIMGVLFAREPGQRDEWLDRLPDEPDPFAVPDPRDESPTSLLVGRIIETLGAAWLGGWQPADVVRHATRELESGSDRLVAACIIDDAQRYRNTTVHPQWRGQLDDIIATYGFGGGSGGSRAAVDAWRASITRRGDLTIDVAIEVLLALRQLPRLQVLIPPPGADPNIVDPSLRRARMAAAAPDGIDRKLLDRVRALLAKAESTTFPEEADSLTVKAQQLMTRHSIDHAMLHGHESEHVPSARRIPVDDPYTGAKFDLLHQIGRANRCETVSLKQLGFATVFGFDLDLDMVELLYTSLLVQATGAMLAAGSQTDAYGRSTTRSFRQSFLVSFAYRIGERLQAAADATVLKAGEEIGSALVPVLAEQEEAINAARDAVFPHLRRSRTRATHAGGWAAGRVAADVADLGARDPSRAEVRP